MASVDVKIENRSGQTVGIRLDEDSDALKRIKKKVKTEQLESARVTKTRAPASKGSTQAPAKDGASAKEGDSTADGTGDAT